MLHPDHVENPLDHVCLVRRSDGQLDLYRPGSLAFDSFTPIPEEAARFFAGHLPTFSSNWIPTESDVVGVFEG
ncbi:MAG: hypothetical protein ABIG32_01360 [Candidatus Uhrbacteria bacterium]|nr:hypothetical protein [Patescibacteria group bacterium]MBU1907155.1 hypothetical protein [Patescibacteria group bacterium]